MDELEMIKNAITCMNVSESDAFPLGDHFRSQDYKFDPETEKFLKSLGYSLVWTDTFKGGCWHVMNLSK